MDKDNLFDARITPLDVVKTLLLIVTCFSTWNIVDLITPDVALAWVRELAAVGVIEGAFLGFEFATRDAKTRKQMQYATVGFFLSLTVIALFAGVSGLLEFGGVTLLNQSGGEWMGILWTVRDVVMLSALVVTVIWIFGLAGIYRLYSLADPDKVAELAHNQIYGDMKTASNAALAEAMNKARPTITIQRAVAQIRQDYAGELSPAQLESLVREVEGHLRGSVHGAAKPPAIAPVSANAPTIPVKSYNAEADSLPPFLQSRNGQRPE